MGSGLAAVARAITDAVTVGYADLPYFRTAGVHGKHGRLTVGAVGGVPAVVFRGRFHLYEGLTFSEVALPVYLARRLGASTLVVTNAAGALDPRFAPGSLMIIRDHLNLMGGSCLAGDIEPGTGSRFVTMRAAYDPKLRRLACEVARAARVRVRQGVYAAVLGPSFETAAEVKMLRWLGADAVGMSTVPEVIAARHAGMRVLGISVIANAAGRCSHQAVLRAAAAAAPAVRAVIVGVARRLQRIVT